MKKLVIATLIFTMFVCSVIGLTACRADDSPAPTIEVGSDGYWYINGEKTDYLAQGEQGIKGDKGDKGDNGENGSNGLDGKTPEISIGDNGNWFIDGVDTGVKAAGEKGEKGDKGEQGEKGSDGKDGVDGSDGKDGQRGKSAYELYVEKYGYRGTEEEWLDDLVNGRLGMRETYTVTFDSNGGSEVDSQEVLDGKRANKPYAPSRTGYTFDGWYLDSTEWNFAIYTITDDTTLTAKWTANTYKIKFVPVGEETFPDMVATYYDDYELPTPPEKERHQFVGWSDGEKIYDQSGKWTTASDVTLTAVYKPDTYTITFEDAEVDPMEVAYNDDSYTLPTPEKEGYMFLGWYLNGEQFTGGICLVENITLTARWEKATEEYAYSDENDEIIILKLKSGVTEFTVPTEVDGLPVTDIASDAFADNTELVSLTFDGSFENYTEKMLQGCTSLKNLVLSGLYDNYLYVLFGNDETAVPESLETVSFALNSPSINTKMLEKKMAGNDHTITYVIPEGITEIAHMQYNDLQGLTSLSLPKSLQKIGEMAFNYYSYNLKDVDYQGTLSDWCKIDGLENLLDYQVSQNIKINGAKLEGEIVIPDGITEIKDGTFRFFTAITSVIIPDGVAKIGSGAFYYCKGLTNINIPDSVTEIGNTSFSTCTELESISIPDSVTYIGGGAFDNCSQLVTVIDGIKYVDSWAIKYESNGIVTANIKEGTKGIGGSAFYGCSQLKTINVPASVKGISNLAFSNCTFLETFNYAGTKAQWNEIRISDNWAANAYQGFKIVCNDGEIQN